MNTTDSIKLNCQLPLESQGQRLDFAVAQVFTEHSRARIQNWIKEHYLTVNGQFANPKDKVHGGEIIEIVAPPIKTISFEAEAIDLDIVYEDEDLIIINKPVGLVVHPAAGNLEGTLLNALLNHEPKLQQIPRAGIVHRLDKDTSGIMMVAKTLEAHTFLVKQLQNRQVQRQYYALVAGNIISGNTIEEPIGRHPQQRIKMAVHPLGKPAITHYRVLKRYQHYTLLKVNLETGRTHQIRVHLAHINHPIVGDKTYGGRLALPKNCPNAIKTAVSHFPRQALHAKRLKLLHPRKQIECCWETELPADIQNLLEILEAQDK